MARPNVLFLIDDQHRHDYLHCAGAEFLRTPNLDALAARGVRFSHCCTNAPVCSPARIALATGLLPSRTGTLTNHDVLPLSVPTHYRHFRDGGYRVELIGRHDLAKPGAPASVHGNRPLNYSYGFTRALEIEGGMACALAARTQGATGPYTTWLESNDMLESYVEDFRKRAEKGWIIGASHDSVLPMAFHQDVFVADRAVERIQAIEDDYPFYMFVSFQSPHDPFDPPRELADKYRDTDVPDAIPCKTGGKPQRIRLRREKYAHATEDDIRIARQQYCAKVELIDQQVGRILAALDARGMRENTIVVFVSDHGEHLGDHGLFIKQTAYECSMRVPLIVAGPGIAQGVLSHALVELFDLNPTLTELAGLPAQSQLDAQSFAAVLQDPSRPHREACVTMQDDFRAIRNERYKLILTDNDTTELYDLDKDPDELCNIADSEPGIVRALASALQRRCS